MEKSVEKKLREASEKISLGILGRIIAGVQRETFGETSPGIFKGISKEFLMECLENLLSIEE